MEAHSRCELRRDALNRLLPDDAIANALEDGADLAGFHCFIDLVEAAAEDAFHHLCRFGVRSIGPEHRRGIADLEPIAFAGEERIQRGRVLERGRFGNRGIGALIVPVGGEGIEIEGNNRAARRLATPDVLDGRMKARDRASIAADQADRGGSPPLVGSTRIDECPGSIAVVNISAAEALTFQGKDDILILHVVRPERRQKLIRRPSRQEHAQRPQAGILRVRKSSQVVVAKGSELSGSVTSFDRGHAQSKGRLVPQKEGLRAGAWTLEGCGHLHHARLLLPTITCPKVSEIGHRSVIVERDGKADLLDGIAGHRSTRQPLVGPRQCREDAHRRTSGEPGCGTFNTPSSSFARKNIEGLPGAA